MEVLQVSNVCASHYWQFVGAVLDLYQGGTVMTSTGY